MDMQKVSLSLLAVFIVLQSCGQRPENAESTKFEPVETRSYYKLGNRNIALCVEKFGHGGPVMLNVHDDEYTSVQAARMVLEESGGQLIRIENGQERLISFEWSGRTYKFDPNRIFTRNGIRKNLLKLNNAAPAPVVNMIQGLAKFVLQRIPSHNKVLIALHNNDDEDLSIESYKARGEEVANAKFVSHRASMDKDDFILTTSLNLYNQLKNRFNTVLQHNARVVDDGSLSVLYGRRGKGYVNVEAELGHLHEQTEMLRTVTGIINPNSEVR